MARIAVVLFALVGLLGISAQAQEPSKGDKADVFVGYSLFRVNPATAGFKSFGMNGGSASGAYNVTRWLGAVADFGGYTNGNFDFVGNRAEDTVRTLLFGPRVSYRHFGGITPFAQVLLGVAHEDESVTSGPLRGFTSEQLVFAWTLGGGVDARINKRFSLRLGQLEYLRMSSGEFRGAGATQNNLRFSSGVVIHF